MKRPPEHWGIVGGGVLGMTLALRLRRQGKQVTLFEAAAHLGGLASAWKLGDVVWDRHYHVILLSDRHLLGLLDELGLAGELVWGETRTGFYTDGRLHSLSNTLEFLRFPPLGLWDKLRLGATIWYASRIKDGRRLEGVTALDWLRRWSGRRTVEKIWQPLLRAKLGENYSRASAAFIWAVIARLYAARRTGLKKEMFGYLRGGYARILGRFAERLGDEGVAIHLRHAVRKVRPVGGRVRLEFARAEPAELDRVILTLPTPSVVQACPDLTAPEKQRLQNIGYQGILCASVLTKTPLAGFYVTNITDPGIPFTALVETTALVDRAHFGGLTLAYLPKYVAADDPAFGLSDEALREQFLAALARMVPHFRREDVVDFALSRVRHVLALTTLHYSDLLPPRQTSLPGVYLVNSAQIVNGTLNVNETVQLAEQAARDLGGLPRPCEANGLHLPVSTATR